MPKHNQQRSWFLILGAIAVVSLVGVSMMPPIAQILSYHDFAGDQRLFGLPNFWNVVSNLPFLLVGFAGLVFCLRSDHLRAWISWAILFGSVAIVAFGSSWYHLDPQNSTLVWDRLPMAVGFMGLFSALLTDYADERAEKILLVPLLAIGIASVVYWAFYDDLRFYIWVQFFPLICILVLLAFFTSPYGQNHYLAAGLGLYVLAKLLELADDKIYQLSGGLIAGHPVKHLVSAGAIYLLYQMLKNRRFA